MQRRKQDDGTSKADSDSSRNSQTNRTQSAVREFLLPILAVLVVLVPLRSAIADWHDVPTGSMRPTILEGDRIWVDKLAYGLRAPLTMSWLARWGEPRRGDVVTLASPADGIRLVKRIVGLPGDRIAMKDNRLTINGRTLAYENRPGTADRADADAVHRSVLLQTEQLGNQSHAVTLTPALTGRFDSFDEFTVPTGHYFFLGDNRDRSRDSRFIGTVALDEIYGRVTHIALSIDPERHYRPRFDRWFQSIDVDVD